MKASVRIPKGFKRLALGVAVKAGDYGLSSWNYRPEWLLFTSDAGRVRKDEIFIRRKNPTPKPRRKA